MGKIIDVRKALPGDIIKYGLNYYLVCKREKNDPTYLRLIRVVTGLRSGRIRDIPFPVYYDTTLEVMDISIISPPYSQHIMEDVFFCLTHFNKKIVWTN